MFSTAGFLVFVFFRFQRHSTAFFCFPTSFTGQLCTYPPVPVKRSRHSSRNFPLFFSPFTDRCPQCGDLFPLFSTCPQKPPRLFQPASMQNRLADSALADFSTDFTSPTIATKKERWIFSLFSFETNFHERTVPHAYSL